MHQKSAQYFSKVPTFMGALVTLDVSLCLLLIINAIRALPLHGYRWRMPSVQKLAHSVEYIFALRSVKLIMLLLYTLHLSFSHCFCLVISRIFSYGPVPSLQLVFGSCVSTLIIKHWSKLNYYMLQFLCGSSKSKNITGYLIFLSVF
jgi:hypothetical protein